MIQIINETINYFTSLPFLELAAVISALVYVILAAKGNRWCWPAAFISTVLYTAIFYDVYLWMDSLLQVYYMAMAVYGWFCWRRGKVDTEVSIINAAELPSSAQHISDKCAPLTIQTWSLALHIKIVLLLALLSLFLGGIMANFTPADFPYFDSATTVYAVFATYLVTKKVLENWLYWVVIDLASIYIYSVKGLAPTAVLFALYVILALYGYYQWQQTLKGQQQLAHA